MIKFIIRCIKQALFGRYTIESRATDRGLQYYLFDGLNCVKISSDKDHLKRYLIAYIKQKKLQNLTTYYFNIDGKEL